MSSRLFEVRDLRIDVDGGASKGHGWTIVVPGPSDGVDAGETLAPVGGSASSKPLMLLGAFGFLPGGARDLRPQAARIR